MSMFSNLFHKNSAPKQTSLAVNPVLSNANQMNNEFLHKQQFNQQGSLLQQQTILTQAPIAPVYQTNLPMQSTWSTPIQPSGLSYRRGGPYRVIRLRTHNWGNRTENGWSGFNNWRYLPQNLASWEPKNYILEELRLQAMQSRGLNLQQPILQQPLLQQPLLQQAPLFAAPLAAAQPALKSGKKSKRGHHHGLRNKRAQAVLPVQPIGGGPAIATIAPVPLVAAPVAPLVATRALPVVAPVATPVASPLVETIIRPTIIQETVRMDRILEVQPVFHRQIEQPVVNHIEKHITEMPAAPLGGVVRLDPLIQQNTSTRVINEVTPIIHREVAVRQVERVEEHLSERVVAPTQHTNSVQYEAAPIVAPATPVLAAPVLAAPVAAVASPTLLDPITAPAIHQTTTMAPIVEETLRTDTLIEVVPVIHREVDQTVINHIEKHITEAPAPLMGGTVRMAPIVQETMSTRVVDEIQPIVHREVAVAQIERVEEHLVEHVVAPTQYTNSVITEASPILMEKRLDNELALNNNTYGSAMM